MKKSLLFTKLVAFALILSLLMSCGSLPCRHCTPEGSAALDLKKVPFSDTTSALYRVSIKLYSMYFSGLLAIKKIEDGSFRMSLISETGFKLFDMEVINGVAEMKNVFSELDRENVKNTFKEDFALLVVSGFSNKICKRYTYERSEDMLFACSEKKEISSNFLIDRKTEILKRVWKAEEIEDEYVGINYGYPESGSMTPAFITIVHSNVKLRMELSILENK
ncbi:MAG TPA: hypothetical protein PLZ43_09905 [bacterium]|nr:hypothetical protein [bacterium]